MSELIKSRPKSTSSAASSLMQDVPGAFPATPQFGADVDQDDENDIVYKTLPQLVYARRAEYVRPKEVRIKVGTWNVAAFKGAEKDVGGWFVGGRGIAERLTGLTINEETDPDRGTEREDVGTQEAHYERKQSTLPQGDSGIVPGHDQVGLYVLGLQEVIDISSATEALRPYTDPAVATKWKDSMSSALPTGYRLVAEQQLLGLLLLVYAAPDVADDVKSVSTTSVGTGLMGYMGNKGAVTARIVLGETTRIVFVNCHMAAGADKTALERRNWDAQQIVSRTRFDPIKDAMDLNQSTGEQIGDEDFAFWCGDLNYRMEGIPGDDVRRLLMLHTRNEYDLSQPSAHKIDSELQQATDALKERVGAENTSGGSLSVRLSTESRRSIENRRPTTLLDEIQASEDPSSLQTTLSSLLPHDELQQQMKSGKAFHDGWQEGPITFLPTYKYDAGTVGVFDSSEKKRAPSWCDRILYRTRRDKLAYEKKIAEEQEARKKDEQMKTDGIDQAASDEDVLYNYDPETDGANADEYDEYDEYDEIEDGVVVTKEGFEDTISQEYYTAHQRVLSSDHKPLDAGFLLKYDAVVPELKAKVHAEVARELDKAENEGRPNVVVVVDRHNETLEVSDECAAEKFEGVWFGDIRWLQSKHRSLTIANTSRVPATFSFIERPVEESQPTGLAPKWLTIKMNGTDIKSSSEISESVNLEPGETANIELELRITNMDDVKDFNVKKRALEDILVLRVENGRDHFIPVRGHWLASSLGRSIDKLVRIPEGGIRKLQGQKPDAKGKVVTAAKTVNAATTLAHIRSSPESGSNVQEMTAMEKTLSNVATESQDEPVRFSAPRELFRLTEAIEELSTKVIAEWEMLNAPSTPLDPTETTSSTQPAPWDEHSAWPFQEECWTERTTLHWSTALSDACNALDEDQALEPALPSDLPRILRLCIFCSLLLTFLHSIPDGVIPNELWIEVDKFIAENDKAKRKLPNDDLRNSIQEILSQSPSHSISFILMTSMLERMIQERSAASSSFIPGHNRQNSRETADLPLSPTKRAGGAFKRIVTGKAAPRQPPGTREQVIHALGKIFGPALVRTTDAGSEKGERAVDKRKAELVEIFLKRDEPG